MPLPSNYRWVCVGSLLVRNRQGALENAPEWTIDDLQSAIGDRSGTDRMYRSYGADSRMMWCEHVSVDDDFIRLLIETGDKNVSGLSLIHFENKESRDVDKDENEGGHYTSHILIKRTPEPNGRHVILVEKVPGVFLSSLKDHFAWVCNDPEYQQQAPGPDGRPRQYRAIFEIDGFQSRTIADALETGVLTDIEFVSFEPGLGDGHDEDEMIDEVVREARWKVGKRVSEEQARGIFDRAREYLDDWAAENDDAEMLVRIKAGNGQIKTTSIDTNGVEVLEQAFIQNEVISDFEESLPPKYVDFNLEVLEKMSEIGKGLGA